MNLHLFIFIFLINLLFSKQEYYSYDMEIPTGNSELKILNIKSDDICEEWIPSLSSPILIAPSNIDATDKKKIDELTINNPFLNFEEPQLDITLYNYYVLNQKFNATLGKIKNSQELKNCHLGLSSRFGTNTNINEKFFFLNILKENKNLNKSIYSFDKWKLNEKTNTIKTNFYLGDSHSDFKENKEKGIIATCQTNKSDPYMGCFFKQMSFNGKTANLKNDTFEYKIYFSTDDYNIIFPKSFENDFNEITGYQCFSKNPHRDDPDYYLFCDKMFNESNFALLNLINDDMNITIEIDNEVRFNIENENNLKHKTKIRYENVEYFILPLIMFKNFHVQFDDENDLIKFYTTNQSILQIYSKNEKKDNDSKGNVGKAFLIIFIILLIVALLVIAFWLIKKRKGKVEKSINKYNKFEDEDNFQNMNDKRVF